MHFHTLYSSFSTFLIFHTPHFPHSALRTPHSALRTPHSALRTPHSALRIPHSSFSIQPKGHQNTRGTAFRPVSDLTSHAQLKMFRPGIRAGVFIWEEFEKFPARLPRSRSQKPRSRMDGCHLLFHWLLFLLLLWENLGQKNWVTILLEGDGGYSLWVYLAITIGLEWDNVSRFSKSWTAQEPRNSENEINLCLVEYLATS